MGVTDKDCAGLCATIYDPGATAWDHFDAGDDDGVCWALLRHPDADILVLRGSVTIEDWLRDLMALPRLVRSHWALGFVDSGFSAGMGLLAMEYIGLRPDTSRAPIIVTGHSLGAARSAVLAGTLMVAGLRPAGRIAFGEPKPGYAKLGEWLAPIKANRSYRNGSDADHDLVTDVPFSIQPLFPYVHPVALTQITAAPPAADPRYDLFAWHDIKLYEAACPATPII